MLRRQLRTRRQGSDESVESYADDITRKCYQLGASEAEKDLEYFVDGVRADLLEHVSIRQSKTFGEALQQAKLKESAPDSTNELRQQMEEMMKWQQKQ